MFKTQKCEKFGSLAILYNRIFKVSRFLIGKIRHLKGHYHECYEHKDMYRQI